MKHVRERNKPLLNAIIGAFKADGTTFNKWCNDNGFVRQNVTDAILGIWRGKKAAELRDKAIADSKPWRLLENIAYYCKHDD